MSTHGALTEDSRSYRVVTPDRKGREGKGREVGHACMVSTGRQTRPAAMHAALRAEIGGGRR